MNARRQKMKRRTTRSPFPEVQVAPRDDGRGLEFWNTIDTNVVADGIGITHARLADVLVGIEPIPVARIEREWLVAAESLAKLSVQCALIAAQIHTKRETSKEKS